MSIMWLAHNTCTVVVFEAPRAQEYDGGNSQWPSLEFHSGSIQLTTSLNFLHGTLVSGAVL